jgi:RNA polymerase sigma-70 factor, ECF subfamily
MNTREVSESIHEELVALLPRLRRFARNLTRHAADADDMVQIALERALARSVQRQADSRLDSWMFKIVRNAWIDEVRARGRRSKIFVAEEAGENVGTEVMEKETTMMSVQAAMLKLPEEQREAIGLVLIEGLPYKEAAAVMDIPIGTLTSRLSRAREALQLLLGEEKPS